MTTTKFSFKDEGTSIFGKIRRPVADVFFKHKTKDSWQKVEVLVDTGADYTLLPKFMAEILGVNIKRECQGVKTSGIGGKTTIFFLGRKMKIKVGDYEKSVPLGFSSSNLIPPIMGRLGFIEDFKVTFANFEVSFDKPQ